MAEATIYSEFLAQVHRVPDAVAVIDGSREVTYRQLADEAEAIGAQLPAGASFVGVLLDHGAGMIASLLAILKIGAAYVPVEPDFPVERRAFMFGECQVDAVITQEAYQEGLEGYPTLLLDSVDLPAAAATGVDCSQPEGLAYVLYTSGTTGTPKGVAVENRNVCSYIHAFQAEFNLEPGDRMLQHSVCTFDIFVEEVFSTLLSGATLVITPADIREDAHRLVQFIEAQRVTVVDGFPYLLDVINEAPHHPRTVRLYISGGDVLRFSQVSRLLDEAAVYNTYGPSETTCCVAYFHCNGSAPSEHGVYPVGYAIEGTTLELVDDQLRAVRPGAVGEILISGPGVSRGYVGTHPEQENFIIAPDGTRWYRSGDMAYRREDGALVFLHRKDDQVMIRGRRVEAKEVENVLLEDKSIHQAVVAPATDEQGLSYLIAYIVPEGNDFSLATLKRRLGRRLAPYMIPEFFVALKSIPLNSHGKPDEERLPVVLKVGDGA